MEEALQILRPDMAALPSESGMTNVIKKCK